MSFENLGLGPNILNAIKDAGYTSATPIQAQAIPEVLNGLDVLGCAQTGTGKTASFTLPIIEYRCYGCLFSSRLLPFLHFLGSDAFANVFPHWDVGWTTT